MGALDWMKFEPAAWLVGTSGFSRAERGDYINLLAHQWERGGYLPADHRQLARMCGATDEEFEKSWSVIGEKFEEDENGYYNPRCLDTYLAAEERMEIWREAGRKSGRSHKGRGKGGSKGGLEGGGEGALRVDTRHLEGRASYSESVSVSREGGGNGGSVRGGTIGVSASLAYHPDDHLIANSRGRDIDVPKTLSESESWLKAFTEWCSYRREIGKTMTPSTVKRQLSMMERLGPGDAVLSMEASIRNGWQGLFDPNGSKRQASHGRQSAQSIESQLKEEDEWAIEESK